MVERLDKVEIAGRKSKSLLEETKIPQDDMLMHSPVGESVSEGFHPSIRNDAESSDSSSGYAIGLSREAFRREFSQLTTLDVTKNETVCSYLSAIRRMEEAGILRSVGKFHQS